MIAVNQISKKFIARKAEVEVLSGLDLQVRKKEFILIKGESGSGKSTLLFTIGGMLRPDSGKVMINDKNIFALSEKERRGFRAKEIGFVFQSYHLLPYLNVLDNIRLSNEIPEINISKDSVQEIANELGLEDRLNHKPSELSAGEKQRVALARALVSRPSLILADEPTGNLDERSAKTVLNHLQNFQKNGGTVIMVTHGNMADAYAGRILRLANGVLEIKS